MRELASLILAEKELYGAGIELTPFMKGYIAATAAVPILNLPDDTEWYDNWHTLVVRPMPFKQSLVRPATGPLTEQRALWLSGVTGLQMPVVIDWQSAKPHKLGHHAREVIIHELAHKIDLQVDDAANGYPPLHENMDGKAWYDAFHSAYTSLQTCLQRPHWSYN